MLEIELEEPKDEDDLAAEDAFDEEIELAAAGRWEELGLDPPGHKADFLPETVEEFLKGGDE